MLDLARKLVPSLTHSQSLFSHVWNLASFFFFSLGQSMFHRVYSFICKRYFSHFLVKKWDWLDRTGSCTHLALFPKYEVTQLKCSPALCSVLFAGINGQWSTSFFFFFFFWLVRNVLVQWRKQMSLREKRFISLNIRAQTISDWMNSWFTEHLSVLIIKFSILQAKLPNNGRFQALNHLR